MSLRSIPVWLRPAPAVFMLAWGGNHFTPLLHLYESVGGYQPWQANLLLGMYVFGLIPGLLVAAALSDRLGRRALVFVGLAAAVAASAMLEFGFHMFWLLCAGRVFAGLGVGVAMSVGSSWIKELSDAPWDTKADSAVRARRSSLTLTFGFAIGAGVTGALAQWAPMPERLPFMLHAALSVIAAIILATAPETVTDATRARGRWWQDLRVPSAAHRTFRRVIIPAAPWVFGAAGVAYAIMPAIVEDRVGQWGTAYATVLTVLTLGIGAVAQTFVPRINRATGGRAIVVGITGMAIGMLFAAVAALVANPFVAVGVALVLGISYGISVVSGLQLVQRLATSWDLAGMTGLYYSLTYVGFLIPTVLAALLPIASYAVSLSMLALICLLCRAFVARGMRRA